jgi:hypothetical protein
MDPKRLVVFAGFQRSVANPMLVQQCAHSLRIVYIERWVKSEHFPAGLKRRLGCIFADRFW